MSFESVPAAMRVGAVLALSAVLFGFVLGGVFGFNEAAIKDRLAASGDAVVATVYQGDTAARDRVVTKSWDYLKRAHLHGGGIGAAALGAIAVMTLMTRMGTLPRLSALAVGAGALLYSVFWMVAGFKAPGLGNTDMTKESLSWIAVPGAGLSILGMLGAILSLITDRRTG